MATIIIPTPLRKFTDNKSSFDSDGSTVQAALDQLVGEYDTLGKQLLTEDGRLRSFLKVYVGDEDIQQLDGTKTALNSDTVVSIIPAIAGGVQ